MTASAGLRILFPRRRAECARRGATKGRRNASRAAVAAAFSALAAACAPTLEYGAKPNTDALSGLAAAVSTPADFRAALGEPRGQGMARFSLDHEPRDLWFYEYVRSDGQTIDLKMLVVLFKDARYDGHFWFSSAEILEPFD